MLDARLHAELLYAKDHFDFLCYDKDNNHIWMILSKEVNNIHYKMKLSSILERKFNYKTVYHDNTLIQSYPESSIPQEADINVGAYPPHSYVPLINILKDGEFLPRRFLREHIISIVDKQSGLG